MADQYVYVQDKDYAWLPALLVEQTKDKARVSVATYDRELDIQGGYDSGRRTETRTVDLKDYPNKALPLQNVIDGRVKQRPDMTELRFLHEAAILFNLKERLSMGEPYTRTGDIVIAVNPFEWLPLYTDKIQQNYSRNLIWNRQLIDHDPRKDLPPHIYETCSLAFRGLSSQEEDQSILVSGESGAGKTETVKIAMGYLANVVQQQEHDATDISQNDLVITRVLDSNPLLEAFGNAKTRRNDNSSRFGKYTQLQFGRGTNNRTHLTLLGSFCEVYLLEKSRVVQHDNAERSFHIFHQLCAADDISKKHLWKHLEGKTAASFAYVGESQTKSIEGRSDADGFKYTIEKLALVGIEGDLMKSFMQAVIAVLLIGNIRFAPDPKDSDHSIIDSSVELDQLAELIGIPSSDLKKTFTTRVVTVRREATVVPLKADAARDSADALAKQIYEKLFLWLVDAINEATRAQEIPEEDQGLIGLLDIFGFESFQANGFEQLCINYANEQLQAKFTKDVFVGVFEEYKSEGINLEEIKYDDNTDVLDLIQNRTGLLAMLNEECIRPNGSDYGFVNKALHINKDSPVLVIPRIVHSQVEFGIKHYAGVVIYDATSFVTKNQDTLPTDLLECVCKSTNVVIAKTMKSGTEMKGESLQRGVPSRKKSNLVAPTVWTKYKEQLRKLMGALDKTQSRYIRCIKPNSFKKPNIMQHSLTLDQLRSSGVVAAVTMARSAFPNRLEHEIILERFYALRPAGERKACDSKAMEKAETEKLLREALQPLEEKGVEAFVMGNTCAYFRAGALEFLEAERLSSLTKPATTIESVVRGFLARRRAFKIRNAAEIERLQLHASKAETIQRAWRCFAAKKRMLQLKREIGLRRKREEEARKQQEAVIKIQSQMRRYLAVKERERRYVKYIRLQAKYLKKKKKIKKLEKCSTLIQAQIRGFVTRKNFQPVFQKATERSVLLDKIARIKKKHAKVTKLRKQEEAVTENGVDSTLGDSAREKWEDFVVTGSEDNEKSTLAKEIEELQQTHRQLQVQTKALEGSSKPMKKHFDAIMAENEELRQDFAQINERSEAMKEENRELLERRIAAEEKTAELKVELSGMSQKFRPVASGTREFQQALLDIFELMEERCKNDKLVETVRRIVLKATRDATMIREAAEAAFVESSPTRQKRILGGSFSNLNFQKTPNSARAARKGTKPVRRNSTGGDMFSHIPPPGLGSPNPPVVRKRYKKVS
eukprot:Nitzschia sp. Nitz4//scaffold16_size188269//162762//166590//NITZ4_001815-RA/size188269-processed-gene-0.28-mRNA-1//1//CDS//3329538589//5737//frame0